MGIATLAHGEVSRGVFCAAWAWTLGAKVLLTAAHTCGLVAHPGCCGVRQGPAPVTTAARHGDSPIAQTHTATWASSTTRAATRRGRTAAHHSGETPTLRTRCPALMAKQPRWLCVYPAWACPAAGSCRAAPRLAGLLPEACPSRNPPGTTLPPLTVQPAAIQGAAQHRDAELRVGRWVAAVQGLCAVILPLRSQPLRSRPRTRLLALCRRLRH